MTSEVHSDARSGTVLIGSDNYKAASVKPWKVVIVSYLTAFLNYALIISKLYVDPICH